MENQMKFSNKLKNCIHNLNQNTMELLKFQNQDQESYWGN